MRNKKLKSVKFAIGLLIILLLSLFIIGRITNENVFAASKSFVGILATNDSKLRAINDAKDWVEKVDKGGVVIDYETSAESLRNQLPAEQVRDDGVYIAYENLRDFESLFCSARGVALPGFSSTIVRSGEYETDVTDQGIKTAYLKESDLDAATCFKNLNLKANGIRKSAINNPLVATQSYTIAFFKNDPNQNRQATPAEAWVLAEQDKNHIAASTDLSFNETNVDCTNEAQGHIINTQTIKNTTVYTYGKVGNEKYAIKKGDKYYKVEIVSPSGAEDGDATHSYVQYAWWKVKTVGDPSAVKDTALAAEAEAFEKYVLEVNNKKNVNDLERNSDGSFKINYKVGMSPENSDEIKVSFDASTNKYKVGPFKVDYFRAATQQGKRAKVSFAGIKSSILVGVDADGKEVLDENGYSVLKLGENYRFIYDDDNSHKEKQKGYGDSDKDYPYPYDDEEFYIEMDYLDNVAGLKNFKFDFQYMTANGQFEYFEGNYLVINWAPYTEITGVTTVTDGGTAALKNDNTVALSNRGDTSSEIGGKKGAGTLKGEYKALVDFSAPASEDCGYVTDESVGGIDIKRRAIPVITKDTITYYGTVECGATSITLNELIWEAAGESNTISLGESKDFVISFSRKKNQAYVKEDISIIVTYTQKIHGESFNKKCTASTYVDYYNSILNNDGNVQVECNDEALYIENNEIMYKGMLERNKVEIDLNAYADGYSGCEKDSIQYCAFEEGNVLDISDYDLGKYTIQHSGNVGSTYIPSIYAVGPDEEYIECIKFTGNSISVPPVAFMEPSYIIKDEVTSGWKWKGITNCFADDAKITYSDKENAKYINVNFEKGPEGYYGVKYVRSNIKADKDGEITVTITDGESNEITLVLTYKADAKTSEDTPTENIPTDDVGSQGNSSWHYEYDVWYYLVAREMSSNVAQAQSNAHGTHQRIDINAEEGLGTVIPGEPVELEMFSGTINLRTAISGKVWIDQIGQKTDKKTSDDDGIGIYEPEKDLLAEENSVEIVVYKVKYQKSKESLKEISREKAIGWNEKGEKIDFENTRVFVDKNGSYNIPEMLVPSEEGLDTSKYLISYDVEFIYDGQTYESTEYLKSTGKNTVKDKLDEFKKTSEEIKGKGKDYEKYVNDSYIVENATERKDFDATFTQVYGGNPVKDDKTTEGYGATNDGQTKKDLSYEGSESSDTQQLISKLVTKDKEGYVLDQYRFAARTSEAGLLLPYETQYHVVPEYYDYLRIQDSYYKPINEYMGQINLGLLERNETDLSLHKDLYSAKIVVNNQEEDYTFGSLNELTGDMLAQYIETGYREQTYKIDLYNSDYYYRSSVYNTAQVELTKRILTALKSGTELRVFVTYQIQIVNNSVDTDAIINQFNDYYDNSFTLVSEDITAKVRNNNDELEDKVVAYKPYYRKLSQTGDIDGLYNFNRTADLAATQIDKGTDEKPVVGDLVFTNAEQKSDSPKYKYSESTSLCAFKDDNSVNTDLVLEPNEKFEVFVTYEVDKDGYLRAASEAYNTENERENLLNSKSNIAEIANYSTLYKKQRHITSSYSAGQVSGRIDKNSAPNNINLEKVDSIEYLENDTSSAPVLKIELGTQNPRKIEGTVWEDVDEEGKTTPNGIKDDNENGIKDIDATLVEKIRLNGDTYQGHPINYNGENIDLSLYDYEFEFVWPDDVYGDNDLKLKSRTSTDENGNYSFENFVSGIYVVRFEYGNKVENIKYNGQDYKNTTYQVDMTNVAKTESDNGDVVIGTTDPAGKSTLNNEWQDLSSNENAKKLEETRVSDARDYEPQRLKVMAYSKTITNKNAEVLAAYTGDNEDRLTDEYKAILEQNQQDLIDNTRMVADTAKLNVEIENPNQITYRRINDSEVSETTEGNVDKEYVIRNLDFGLVKRPETIINTKKEVSRIELFKNDSEEAVLSVECDDEGNIKKDVEETVNSNKITEIAKNQLQLGSQGFKYVAVEASYLKGLTVKITYKITVTNNSEEDYVSSTIASIASVQDLYNKAVSYETEENTYEVEDGTRTYVPFNVGKGIVYGKYVGLYYYTNNKDAVKENDEDISNTLNEKYGYGSYMDTIVTTTVNQVTDYIDNDISIDKVTSGSSIYTNNAWAESTAEERNDKFSLVSFEKTDDKLVKADDKFVDNKNRSYIAGEDGNYSKNNIALSVNDHIYKSDVTYNKIVTVDSNSESEEKDLEIKDGVIVPKIEQVKREGVYQMDSNGISEYNSDLTNGMKPGESRSIMIITSAQANDEAMQNMNYDNLMEIVVYSNSVGRRDMEAIPGNANQIAKQDFAYKAGYLYDYANSDNGYVPQQVSIKGDNGTKTILTERDAYAARDTVTFSEPTGLSLERERIDTTVRVVLVLLLVAAVAIIGVVVVMVVKKTKYDDSHLIKG